MLAVERPALDRPILKDARGKRRGRTGGIVAEGRVVIVKHLVALDRRVKIP